MQVKQIYTYTNIYIWIYEKTMKSIEKQLLRIKCRMSEIIKSRSIKSVKVKGYQITLCVL